MRTRIANLWRPQNFQLQHRLGSGGGYFEGWYFKLVDAAGAQPYAIIPGVFLGDEDAHAFIQLLDGAAGEARYHRFPLDSFRAERGRFAIEIAGNRFGSEGIHLEIEKGESSTDHSLRGDLRFSRWQPWPVRPLSPGVMGPYSFVPFMQCKHGILSFDHTIEGRLSVDGRETSFDGGRGYSEKDWGRSFPAGYVWTQCNHFDGAAATSLSASVARIPWLTGAFRGFLIGLLHEGELHRFTTYTGARIESLALDSSHLRLRVRNRTHRLEIEARKEEGATLRAPYERQMLERVAETMRSEVALSLSRLDGNRPFYAARGRHACLEMQGDLAGVIDA